MVILHMRDLQILQDHSAVAVSLHHVQVVVLFGVQEVQSVGDTLAYCGARKKKEELDSLDKIQRNVAYSQKRSPFM